MFVPHTTLSHNIALSSETTGPTFAIVVSRQARQITSRLGAGEIESLLGNRIFTFTGIAPFRENSPRHD